MKKQAGLTLIETIVYLAIISVVLVSIVGFSNRIISVSTKSRTMEEVQQNARFALERIAQEVRGSAAVDETNSTLDSNLVAGGYLQLDQGTVGDPSDDLYIQVTNNKLTFKTGPSGTEQAITSDNIKVTDLTFTLISDIGNFQSLKVDFTSNFNNASDLHQYDWEIDLDDTLTLRAPQ